MDLCVPTAENPNGNVITIKEIPRVKAVCVTHVGPYNTMQKVYEAIDRFAQKNKLKLKPPFQEVFIKGPNIILKENSDKYITEIIFQ